MAASAKPLKIGLVLDTSLDPNDGVQQYVVSIGEWLRSQGNEVQYLVGETRQRNLPGIHSLARNITVRFNGNRTTIPLPTSRRKLQRFLRQEQFDVLHVQTPHSPFMGHKIILEAAPGTAIIGTFHVLPYGIVPRLGNRALGIWLHRSLRRFDQIVSVSPAAAEFAQQTFRIQTEVLPNVIDYRRFHAAKPLPAYDDDVLTILFLGRLVERKGCQVLLEAVAYMAGDQSLPKFRVVVCGTGHLEAKLRKFITAHNLTGLVELVGFVSEADKPRYYASADISVFPSRGGESFGIVLLEAMASGRAAVLAGDNPGYRSVMAPWPELLFDPYSATGLADKLAIYLKDAARRGQAQRWGADYTKQFDVAVVGRQLLDIYARALIKRRNS